MIRNTYQYAVTAYIVLFYFLLAILVWLAWHKSLQIFFFSCWTWFCPSVPHSTVFKSISTVWQGPPFRENTPGVTDSLCYLWWRMFQAQQSPVWLCRNAEPCCVELLAVEWEAAGREGGLELRESSAVLISIHHTLSPEWRRVKWNESANSLISCRG